MGKYRTYCSLLISADDLFHSFHLMTFKINIMMKIFNVCCICCLLLVCEKPYIVDTGEDDPSVVVPGDVKPVGEVLWAENDTARFYLQGVELCDVVLTYSPAPSMLITNPLYRLPTKIDLYFRNKIFSYLNTFVLPCFRIYVYTFICKY